jgi:DNA-binding CsgD family transcriptional regulator
MEMFSQRAGDLYARLVKADGLVLGDGAGQVCPSDPALTELCQHGLAWVSAGQAVHPVSPDLALGKLLLRRQREILARHTELIEDYERLAQLARTTCSAGSPYVETLISAAQVSAAQRDLQAGALWDYRALGIPWLVRPAAPGPEPARRHLIWTADLLTECGSQLGGEDECRTVPAVPMRMLVADGVGLILLTATGVEAGALVRAPVVVAALAHYFDLLWERATPVSGRASTPAGGEQVPRSERVMLGLLMAGLTDAAIARTLGISARSVRRHVAALEDRAGVTTRFALGAAAVRLGWVSA